MRDWAQHHKTMVLLGVSNEAELVWWRDDLHRLGMGCTMFHEPDNETGYSALACLPEDGKTFRTLKLL